MAKSAVVGALRVTLGIDTAAFEAGLNRIEKQMRTVGKRMQAVGRTMSMSVTAPLTLAGGTALKFAADFEAAMSRARAVLNPTQAEFRMLSDLALELGRTTRFTAAQAADGIEMLARNGLKAGDILSGAAAATLNLASAAGADLAPSADVMTDIMVNFNKTGEELVSTVDNIAGVLVNSKFDWEDYALAVGQAAGAAGPIGMSFEDMNAALAATAPSFSSGVEAGTSLKGMLLKLAPASKQSKQRIQEMGLEFWDAAGNLKSLADIAEEMRIKLGDLTKEAQTEVLGELFGQRTIRTAFRLMEEGREGIERLKAAIADVSAEQMARDRLDNLNGALLMLKSAVEGLAIAIANSGILQWARDLVDWLTEVTRSLIDTDPAMLKLVAVIGMVAAALGPLLLAMGLFAAAIGAIGLPLAGLTAAIVGVTTAVAAFWPEIKEAARIVGEAFRDMYHSARLWLLDRLKPIFKTIGWAARQMGIELSGVFAEVTSDVVEKAAKEGGLGAIRAAFAETAAASQQAARDSIGPWLTVTNAVKEQLSGTRTLTGGIKTDLDEIVRSPLHTLGEKMAAVDEAFRAGQIPLAEYRDLVRSLREEEFQMLHEVARATLDDIIYSPLETFTAKMQALEEALRNGTIGFREFGAMAERVQQDNMSNWDALASSAAGALTSIFGKSKGAAIAAAVINTAQAVTRNLAQYPWPFGAAMAALAAASGAAQIATIKSTNVGGGGKTPSVHGGSGGTAAEPQQAALPAQTLHVAGIAPGQFFKGEAMRELVEELLQFQRDGGRVVLA